MINCRSLARACEISPAISGRPFLRENGYPRPKHSFVPLAHTRIALDPGTELAISLKELSPAALRMRRLREWRPQGRACLMVDPPPWAMSGLIDLRWPHPLQRGDRAAVVDAFHRFVGYALDVTRNTGR
jgi:hypothetical protein